MDQELLMKQIVEQVMAAMNKGAASAPSTPAGGRMTAANYPLAEKETDKLKTPTGKPFSSLSYEKVLSGELTSDDMRIAPETPKTKRTAWGFLSRSQCSVSLMWSRAAMAW